MYKHTCRILDAHPRIGAPTPGLSAQSAQEQRTTEGIAEAVLMELAALNTAYEARFGFKFVVFVNGRTRAEILPVFRVRLMRQTHEEREEGLGAMVAIARARLHKLL